MRASVFPARRAATRPCAFLQRQQQQRRQQQQQQQQQIRDLTTTAPRHGVSEFALTSPSLRPRPRLAVPPAITSKAATRRSSSTTSSDNKGDATEKAEAKATPPTHYELFPQTLPDGPPPRGKFHIDTQKLRREFIALQVGSHPDLNRGGGSESGSGSGGSGIRSQSHAQSARINEAYRTLARPLARAQYVLALRGRDVANDETASVRDPELLGEVLEARETIEEAAREDDLDALRAANEERIRRCEELLGKLFAADDLDGAADEVVRLRYWVNVRESIDNWEEGKPVVLEH
ncbi:Co-chaperone Hsc20 [Nemania sp. NC0429]|nr:Co-chaperone Hsc20 [Nemania sp. NC0429]